MPTIKESIFILFTIFFTILLLLSINCLLLLYMLFYWCKSIRNYIFNKIEKLDDFIYEVMR